MPQINGYSISFVGGPNGFNDTRVQIYIWDALNKNVATIRFTVPGMAIKSDFVEAGGRINMYLPSEMLQNVLDVLRNEKPLTFFFGSGRAYIGTYEQEPVGEGE